MDRNAGGPDDSFSVEPEELYRLCKDVKTAWLSIGKPNYARTEAEKGNVKFRRSLYFVKDIKAGTIITNEHVKSIRPGFGLPPKFLNDIIGKRIEKDVNFGTPVKKEHII